MARKVSRAAAASPPQLTSGPRAGREDGFGVERELAVAVAGAKRVLGPFDSGLPCELAELASEHHHRRAGAFHDVPIRGGGRETNAAADDRGADVGEAGDAHLLGADLRDLRGKRARWARKIGERLAQGAERGAEHEVLV